MENHVLIFLTSQVYKELTRPVATHKKVSGLQGIDFDGDESYQLNRIKNQNCQREEGPNPVSRTPSSVTQLTDKNTDENSLRRTIAIQVDETKMSISGHPPRRVAWPLRYREYTLFSEDEESEEYRPISNSVSVNRVKGKPGQPCKIPKQPSVVSSNTNKHSEVLPEGGTKKRLSRHLFVCKVCSRGFSHKGNLKSHLRVHSSDKLFACEKCNKSFKSKEALLRHQFIHTGEKPFSCSECTLRFSSALSLKEHQARHSNEMLYRCEVCDRGFRQISALKRHLTVHSKDTPFSCDICGRSFSQKSYLRKHLRTHTGEKPYVCSTCGKCFSHSSDLKRHKIIHTGQKPFTCKYCSATFSDPSSNRRHEKEHVSTKRFSCQICNLSFKRGQQLKHHVMKNHTVQVLLEDGLDDPDTRAEVLIDNECVIETSEMTNDNNNTVNNFQATVSPVTNCTYSSRNLPSSGSNSTDIKISDKHFNPEDKINAQKNTRSDDDHNVNEKLSTSTTESSSKDKDENVAIIKHLLNMPSIVKYIDDPDFTSQDYYDWLSNFVLIAKLIPIPMEVELFAKISQVHKTLTDMLSAPSGILSTKENYEIVLGISKQLYDITSNHLTYVYNSLDNQKE